MQKWYQMRERGAGRWRLELMWWLYRIMGARVAQIVAGMVAVVATLFSVRIRNISRNYRRILNDYQRNVGIACSRFTPGHHIRQFAYSVVDKVSAICDKNSNIRFVADENANWIEFREMLSRGGGAFLICSHLGNIEVLSAFRDTGGARMNAFMNMTQNRTFREFINKHARYNNTVIHSVENIDVAMAGAMYDAIARGELVMMAGDRMSPNAPNKYINVTILNRECKIPMGVFRFARACGCPIFAIVVVSLGRANYRICMRRMTNTNITTMGVEYAAFLQELILQYPEQWFNFFDFFGES